MSKKSQKSTKQNTLSNDQFSILRIRTIVKQKNFIIEKYRDFIENLSKVSLDSFHHSFLDNYFLGFLELF